MQINGSVAIVTGGASGMGEATARHYLSLGAKVALFDLNDERGKRLAEELGDNAIYRKTNVADEESVSAAIAATAETFGAIHICNNFAGIALSEKTLGRNGPHVLDNYRKVIDINLVGTFNVLRLCAEQMAKQAPVTDDGGRGVIINTASIAAFEGQVGQAAYSASKSGIVGMTLPIARDLAPVGIRCLTIAPGLIHTPMFDHQLTKEVQEALANSVLNPKRLGKPEEIAHLCQFLVENDYINGETIRLDGGLRMQPR